VDVVGDDGKLSHDGGNNDLFGFVLGFKAGDEVGECLYPIGDHRGHEEHGAQSSVAVSCQAWFAPY